MKKVIRSGVWFNNNPGYFRCAYSYWHDPKRLRHDSLSFRIVSFSMKIDKRKVRK